METQVNSAPTFNWKVSGMSCTNCALSIQQYLQQQGAQDIKVNFIGGDVSFRSEVAANNLVKGIENLGYRVEDPSNQQSPTKRKKWFKNHLHRFLFCFIFTAPLMLHMIPGLHLHFLMNPYVQLALTVPVYVVGMDFFGRSAWNSFTKGVPNMNVLITLGSSAALIYSLYGTLTGQAEQYLFYETTCTILTLVFLGYWMEDKSIETTQAAIKKLTVSQKIMANMIAFDDQQQEQIFSVESTQLRVGDLLLIKAGEYVPQDCKILWGEATINESILTGESVPVLKKMNDTLIGGSMVEAGTLKAYVSAVGEDTVMSHIVRMVKEAQAEKPPVQQLADKISAVFVPTVIGIAVLTILLNYILTDVGFTQSLLRSIAVLVIACPCAMGLATPAAIAVGLGRAAQQGILFKNAKSLEVFKSIKRVVFDKTGTLTTGHFVITKYHTSIDDESFKQIAFSLEKYGNHPIARCISQNWKRKDWMRWTKVEEVKGLGVWAFDKEGNKYGATSSKGLSPNIIVENSHNVFITKNDELIGWIDVADEIRPEAKNVIDTLHRNGVETIMLSGDNHQKCLSVAEQLGIKHVISEQTPEQKLAQIEKLNNEQPTAMVGDGINDAPALAKATVGVSLSDASQIALQSAQVILTNKGLAQLPLALGLGKHTFITIKENLFWAFSYNIVAIPVAAMGFLQPTIAALIMGLSDVVLAINSIRLRWKKVHK
jgi:Cu+-exporting ATPase